MFRLSFLILIIVALLTLLFRPFVVFLQHHPILTLLIHIFQPVIVVYFHLFHILQWLFLLIHRFLCHHLLLLLTILVSCSTTCLITRRQYTQHQRKSTSWSPWRLAQFLLNYPKSFELYGASQAIHLPTSLFLISTCHPFSQQDVIPWS